MKKSIDEINKLKRQWENDPCWDIEDTEGFEEYKEELLAYRKQRESEWEKVRITKENIRLCPYLPITEERKAVMIGTGDITVTYFNPCLKEKCMAYREGKCKK